MLAWTKVKKTRKASKLRLRLRLRLKEGKVVERKRMRVCKAAFDERCKQARTSIFTCPCFSCSNVTIFYLE